ncbi:carbohydrate ABC transporter permease [Paenibacillus tarimensis]
MALKNRLKNRYKITFWLFIAPCVLLFTVFFLIPLILSIGFSFTNYDGWKTMDFVGLKNYSKLFADNNFYSAMGRTFIFTLLCLPFMVVIPLLLAVLVTNRYVKGKGMVRTMLYIPVLLSPLVVGVTINWMYSQEYGIVNYIIESLGGTAMEWALNPMLATFVIGFAVNWAAAGFYMIIYVGGIKNISSDLYEAASIDGASALQSFFKITVPMLAPTTFLVLLLSTINLLKEYAVVQGITLGGPGTSTTFIIQYIFSKGFNQNEYGYASAISTVVMLVFIVIAYVQFKASKGGETY